MLKDNKLEKFTKNKNKKKIITISVIAFVLLIGVITLYRTFALYEEKLEFNLIQGKVPEYTSGDVSIAAIIDGEKSSTIPSKNDGYEFVSVECNNGAEAEWNNDTWKITIGNLSKSKTMCTLTFKTKEQTSGSGGVDFITNLAETNPEELAYDGTEDNNLRYIGANPNNYVKFNNEIWRIIGVMNNITDSEGNVGSHIKIIRNESIGDYEWGYSINDWTKSTLNTVTLNDDFYNRLTDNDQMIISNIVWNLGGHSTVNSKSIEFYNAERGTKVYSGRPKTWTGRIGLMYPSDAGYAVGGSVKDTCLETDLSSYNSNNCYANDWLFMKESTQWTLTHNSSYSNYAYLVRSGGIFGTINIDNTPSVSPVLYLNSNVEIIGGDGSASNPYTLG